MNSPVRPIMTALAASLLAVLACSLPFSGDPPSQTQPPSIEETGQAATEGQGVDPFLPTATPTVDAEAVRQSIDVSGTIEIEFDGEPTIWHTGSIQGEEGPVPLSDWYRAPLQTIGNLYSFEIYALDLESFLEATSEGTAGGGAEALVISFGVEAPSSGQTMTYQLPAADSLTSAEVVYLVPESEQVIQYLMTSGELTVRLLQAEPGQPASLEGTLTGTLTYAGPLGPEEPALDPERVIELTEGELIIESIPYDPIFD